MKGIVKNVPKRFVSIGDKLLAYDDLVDLVEELEDADGMFSAIVIYDGDVAEVLEELGVARRTTRGSYAKGSDKAYKAFRSALREVTFEEEKDAAG